MENLNKELTIIIKTFQRKKSLRNLLNSLIKTNITEYKIIILDDSKNPYKDYIEKNIKGLNIEYIVAKFDTGLSKGRNIMLQHVKTPYFLLCDDDYIFDKSCKIRETLEILKKENADIVGGIYLNYLGIHNFYELLASIRHPMRLYKFIFNIGTYDDYSGIFEVREKVLYKIQKQNDINKIRKVDITHNFFIANTNKIREIGGWREELILGEHTDFFYNAKLNNLKVLLNTEFKIQHHPIRSFAYNKYRERNKDGKFWLKKYGLEDYKIIKN